VRLALARMQIGFSSHEICTICSFYFIVVEKIPMTDVAMNEIAVAFIYLQIASLLTSSFENVPVCNV
jgi:hypothetical protein